MDQSFVGCNENIVPVWCGEKEAAEPQRNLLIYWPVYIPDLTYGHWNKKILDTSDWKGHYLKDKVRTSVIWSGNISGSQKGNWKVFLGRGGCLGFSPWTSGSYLIDEWMHFKIKNQTVFSLSAIIFSLHGVWLVHSFFFKWQKNKILLTLQNLFNQLPQLLKKLSNS